MAHVVSTGTAPASSWLHAVGHFVRHLAEMCAAMCVGFAVLDLPFIGVAKVLGYSDPIHELPELSALVVAFNMSLPMALWMRHRGHRWDGIMEMTAAMFVEAGVLISASWAGAVSGSTVVAWQHALMMPVMVVVMLFRLDLYTGRAHHVDTARSLEIGSGRYRSRE